MKNNKLWKLWNSLDQEQLSSFLRWHQANWGEKQVFQQALASLLKVQQATPERNVIWQALYPDISYDDGRFRKLCRDLLASLEDFLAIETFRKTPWQSDIYLLQYLVTHSEPALFIQTYRRVARKIAETRQKGVREAQALSALEQWKLNFLLQHPLLAHEFETPAVPELFSPVTQAFDNWISLEVLGFSMLHYTYRQAGVDLPNTAFATQAFQATETNGIDQQYPSLLVFREVFAILADESPIQLQEINLLIEKIRLSVSQKGEETLHKLLLNSAAQIYNRFPFSENARVLIAIYDWGIEDRLLNKAGYLNNVHYRNLLNICLSVGEIEMAFNYLNNLKLQLAPEIRDGEFAFCQARYFMAKKEYSAVIKAVTATRFVDSQTQIQVQLMLIQAHYERGSQEPEWISGLIKQVIRYTRSRTDIPFNMKQSVLPVLNLLNRLLYTTLPGEIRKLMNQCAALPPTQLKRWVEQKIQERLT